MFEIENRGKSLQCLQLCEQYNVNLTVKLSENGYDRIYTITSKKYPDEILCMFSDGDIQTNAISDMWRRIIDVLVTTKLIQGNERFFEPLDKESVSELTEVVGIKKDMIDDLEYYFNKILYSIKNSNKNVNPDIRRLQLMLEAFKTYSAKVI